MISNQDINKDNFLKELTALSRKYDLYIGGCGCCGSPFIQDDLKVSPQGHYLLSNEEPAYKFGGEVVWVNSFEKGLWK